MAPHQMQVSCKGQNQLAPLKGGQGHQNKWDYHHWQKGGQSSSAIGKKGGDQSKGQQSQFSQKGSSKGSAPYSNSPQGGHGFSTNFSGACFSCSQLGHKYAVCPQKAGLGSSRGAAMSEPTMGDASRSHKVFVVVDNHQDEHQGTVVKATSMLYGISSSILFDLGASDSFISPSHVQQCGLVVA